MAKFVPAPDGTIPFGERAPVDPSTVEPSIFIETAALPIILIVVIMVFVIFQFRRWFLAGGGGSPDDDGEIERGRGD